MKICHQWFEEYRSITQKEFDDFEKTSQLRWEESLIRYSIVHHYQEDLSKVQEFKSDARLWNSQYHIFETQQSLFE